jgi:hypothetical protein
VKITKIPLLINLRLEEGKGKLIYFQLTSGTKGRTKSSGSVGGQGEEEVEGFMNGSGRRKDGSSLERAGLSSRRICE